MESLCDSANNGGEDTYDVLYLPTQQRDGSWQLLVVAGLGDTGERRVVGQVGGCHRQGPWVAKQQCWSPCCGPHVRILLHVMSVWCCKEFDARALRRGPRVPRGRTWENFSENCSNSLHIVSFLQSKSSPFAALAFIGDPHSAPSAGPSHP